MDRWLPGRLIPTSRDRASWHSPILLDWRDMGLSEPEWVAKREACDINQHWSAAILERDGAPYAYFCEVAGALDGIRGENHGIPAVPGWWRFKMDRFGDQVKSCCDAGCGVPLKRLGHQGHRRDVRLLDQLHPARGREAALAASLRAAARGTGRGRHAEPDGLPGTAEREAVSGVLLANVDYRRHMTTEGDEFQEGLRSAGWTLCGVGYDGLTDVPGILDRYQPDRVVVHDKRDWDPASAIAFRKDLGFTRLSALRQSSAFKAVVVKDAASSLPYQKAFYDEVGADAAIVYYHEQSVTTHGMWFAGQAADPDLSLRERR
jgi:hypothetical protein